MYSVDSEVPTTVLPCLTAFVQYQYKVVSVWNVRHKIRKPYAVHILQLPSLVHCDPVADRRISAGNDTLTSPCRLNGAGNEPTFHSFIASVVSDLDVRN